MMIQWNKVDLCTHEPSAWVQHKSNNRSTTIKVDNFVYFWEEKENASDLSGQKMTVNNRRVYLNSDVKLYKYTA